MNNQNPSEDELALFSQLEDVFSEVEKEEIKTPQDLSTPELIKRIREIKDELFAMGQAIKEPISRKARDLHSEYYACQLELHRRKNQ